MIAQTSIEINGIRVFSKPIPSNPKFQDLSGNKYGYLTVVFYVGSKPNSRWYCKCDCGGSTIACSGDLKSGHTASCGCKKKAILSTANKTHGYSNSNEYSIWTDMKGRCYRATHTSYKYYGMRGIKVCDRWKNSFENFYEDMGKRPSKHHSIDRIDSSGDYSPGNCKWSDHNEQARNKGDYKTNVSGVKGVHWCNTAKKWKAQIGVNRKRINLGTFNNLLDAVMARKQAEIIYW